LNATDALLLNESYANGGNSVPSVMDLVKGQIGKRGFNKGVPIINQYQYLEVLIKLLIQ
jgi:hypothetical protein